MRALVVTLTLLSSGFLLATPYLTSQDLQDAFRASDTEKIDELVDFDSVRKSVSKQLSPQKKIAEIQKLLLLKMSEAF